MKRILSLVLSLCLVLGLCACGGKTETPAGEGLSWQEQYDLGIRYLSEGNYEEAIIAFTAAIEIDPKRPEAFVGRGDAYVGTVQLTESAELPEEGRTAYESAAADYLAAIGLDKLLAAVYGKAADVYLTLGDTEAAKEILQLGADATGDAELTARLASMSSYGNVGKSAPWSWDGYDHYYEGELMDTYRVTAYNEQGLPAAGEETDPHDGEVTKSQFEWDEQGRLLSITYLYSDGRTQTITGQYDELGRVLPDEADMTYEYDQQGRVTKITYEAEGTDQSYAEITYDAQGRFARQDYYDVHNGETYHNYTIYTYND